MSITLTFYAENTDFFWTFLRFLQPKNARKWRDTGVAGPKGRKTSDEFWLTTTDWMKTQAILEDEAAKASSISVVITSIEYNWVKVNYELSDGTALHPVAAGGSTGCLAGISLSL